MEAAKKLILVDEFDREYKRLKRPADAVVKTTHSLQLSDRLHDESIGDDQKVREYVAALHRYLNLSKGLPKPEETKVKKEIKINPIDYTPPIPIEPIPRRQRTPAETRAITLRRLQAQELAEIQARTQRQLEAEPRVFAVPYTPPEQALELAAATPLPPPHKTASLAIRSPKYQQKALRKHRRRPVRVTTPPSWHRQ